MESCVSFNDESFAFRLSSVKAISTIFRYDTGVNSRKKARQSREQPFLAGNYVNRSAHYVDQNSDTDSRGRETGMSALQVPVAEVMMVLGG